ncbi:MAG: inorganic phosphate transporter, partial [Clostridia bacterium]|nr:inorganic phosphate transporter [Clostridia bacterium]
MIYVLLFAGLFMGWSLGTNDAANAFGTAVATRVVKYRTAIIIIAAMVLLGS